MSYSVEAYTRRPADGPTCAPGTRSPEWPTGFAGGGWLVRRDGEIVFAHAWRAYCLEYVEARQS